MTSKKQTANKKVVEPKTDQMTAFNREVWADNQIEIAEKMKRDAEAMMRKASVHFTEANRKIKYSDFIVSSSLLIVIGLLLLFFTTKQY